MTWEMMLGFTDLLSFSLANSTGAVKNRFCLFAITWLTLSALLATAIDSSVSGGLPIAFVHRGSSLLAKQQLQQQEKLLQPRSMLETAIPNLACGSSILLASPAAATPIDDVDNNDNNKKKNAQQQQQQQHGDFAFFDEAFIYVRAGSGGQGSSTYKKAKKGANGIPDGGSGGSGGNVILRLDPGLNTLAGLGVGAHRPNALGGAAASSKRGSNAASSKEERLLSFRAKDGTSGGRMYDNGRKGEDCEVLVPPGTVVQRDVPSVTMAGDDGDGNGDDNPENGSDVSSSSNDWAEVGTISKKTPEIVVARGGKGGEGTATLKGKKKGATRRGPEGGEKGRIKLVLKIVADIALVGVPNAGKSTFLAAVTRAKPRIADYPFTTVVPNLGTWIPEGFDDRNDKQSPREGKTNGLVLCDVPGLIEGASDGVGLGHAFLRHIERCRVILHLVDATSEDPVGDYTMVNDELRHYGSGSLSDKPQVVVLNKIDAAFGGDNDFGGDGFHLQDQSREMEEKKEELATKMKLEMGHTRLLWVSAKEKKGVDDLMIRMASYVGKIRDEEEQQQAERDEKPATPIV